MVHEENNSGSKVMVWPTIDRTKAKFLVWENKEPWRKYLATTSG